MTQFRRFDTVKTVRRQFYNLTPNETGTLELINARFIANEPSIFGKPNDDWHRRELDWYLSTSRNVSDIEAPIPKIWCDVADDFGLINSNYGWCIFSDENGNQFDKAVEAIRNDPATRQAVMIYTRPTMHEEATQNGRRDFICTNTVQLMLRDDRLHYIVNMRSNDAVFGYKGDYAWADYVHRLACEKLKVDRGHIIWNANSLHVYPRHFKLVLEAWENDPEW